MLTLKPGHWDVPQGESARGQLGFLIIEGLLARDIFEPLLERLLIEELSTRKPIDVGAE